MSTSKRIQESGIWQLLEAVSTTVPALSLNIMSTSTTVRTIFRRTPTLKRNLSSKPSSTAPEFSLPPEKLRALISLYHQTESFVTPENLERKITDTFVYNPDIHKGVEGPFMGWSDISSQARDRLKMDKLAHPDTNVQVFEALYGTSHGKKAGLETIRESWGQLEERLNGDREEREAREDTKTPRTA
ncbi:hypothetical protein OF83DRAFT_1172637 [Amylostereum chailletii]|nr:hypothetical protein OF83DRAFT_1172637 [Amylostereum chailletii]